MSKGKTGFDNFLKSVTPEQVARQISNLKTCPPNCPANSSCGEFSKDQSCYSIIMSAFSKETVS